MASYQILQPVPPAGTAAILVRDDGAFIPCDLANRDYQEFLIWLDEGNPAPEGWTGPENPTAEPA